MKKRTWCVLLAICLLVVAGGIWFSKVPASPSYQGEPLSAWLRNEGEGSRSDAEALNALRAVNTKALPWLLWAAKHGHEPDRKGPPSPPTLWTAIRSKLGLNKKADFYNERRRAIWALCRIEVESKEVINFMRSLIGDPCFGMQAACYLARKGEAQQTFLIQTSTEGTESARRQAVSSFAEMPTSSDRMRIPAILRAMSDSAPSVRAEGAVVYAAVAEQSDLRDLHAEAIPLLIDLLSDPTAEVKEAAAWALLKRGWDASSAVPKAIELLSDPELSVRIRIAKALGLIDREQASKAALLAIADGAEPMALRTTAAEALGRFGVRSHLVDELAASLGSQDHAVKMEAVQSLLEIGPIAADTAPRILEAYEQYSGTDSILEFDRFGLEVAILYWTQALSHRNPTVRERAARALGARNQIQNNPVVVAALTQAAMDPEKSVQAAATRALQRIQEDR